MNGEHPEAHLVQRESVSCISAFDSLESDAKEALVGKLTLRSYLPRQTIYFRGSPANEVFFVIEGRVRLCDFSKAGKQVHFEELTPGMMFGGHDLYCDATRGAEAIAVEATQVAVMNAAEFKQIVQEHPSVNAYVLRELALFLRITMNRIFEFSTANVPQRIRSELLRIAAQHSAEGDRDIVVSLPPTHAEIASRISTHREAVTRELKKLEGAGTITWKPGTYVIHDSAALLPSAANIKDTKQ